MDIAKINRAVVDCKAIIETSTDCANEVDLWLGAIGRHPDWSERELLELHRKLLVDFAHQLCQQRESS